MAEILIAITFFVSSLLILLIMYRRLSSRTRRYLLKHAKKKSDSQFQKVILTDLKDIASLAKNDCIEDAEEIASSLYKKLSNFDPITAAHLYCSVVPSGKFYPGNKDIDVSFGNGVFIGILTNSMEFQWNDWFLVLTCLSTNTLIENIREVSEEKYDYWKRKEADLLDYVQRNIIQQH